MAPADPCYHGSPGTAIAEPPLAAAHRPDGTDRAPLTRDYRMLHRRGGSGRSASSRAAGAWGRGRAAARWPTAARGPRGAAGVRPAGPASAACWPPAARGPRGAAGSPGPRDPAPGAWPPQGPAAGVRRMSPAGGVRRGPGRIGRGVARPDATPRPGREPSAPVPAIPVEPGQHAATQPLAPPGPRPCGPARVGPGN